MPNMSSYNSSEHIQSLTGREFHKTWTTLLRIYISPRTLLIAKTFASITIIYTGSATAVSSSTNLTSLRRMTCVRRCVIARTVFPPSQPSIQPLSLIHFHSLKSSIPFYDVQKLFGTALGLTTKIPVSAFRYTSGVPKVHRADNESRARLTREFCGTCGSGNLEFGEPARNDWRYVMTITMDEPDALPREDKFFCKKKESVNV